MAAVHEILRTQGPRSLVSIHAEGTVLEATRLMNDRHTGSVLVMHAGRVAGIFTERDVLRRVVAAGRSPEATPVREVMTVDVVCCSPATAVEDLGELMRRRRIRHVPVVDDDGLVVGLVSMGDVNAHRFNHCEIALHQVEDYILNRA
ncbi:MAG: CBS domain-containing protein [Planctomycetia bacterium]|nr:CBS domain-containing protein [Planctomycetia bacterium]